MGNVMWICVLVWLVEIVSCGKISQLWVWRNYRLVISPRFGLSNGDHLVTNIGFHTTVLFLSLSLFSIVLARLLCSLLECFRMIYKR